MGTCIFLRNFSLVFLFLLSRFASASETWSTENQSFKVEIEAPKGIAEKGIAVLVHGFGRSPKQLEVQALKLRNLGFITIKPTVGIPQMIKSDLGAEFAKAFEQLKESKEFGKYFALPKIVLGHSSGATWGTRFAGMRHEMGDNIKGMILIDPVTRDDQKEGFLEALRFLPKLALFEPPTSCNAKNGIKKSYAEMPESFLGVHLAKGSHCDIEAGNTDFICELTCGKVLPANAQRVSDIVTSWSEDLFSGNTQGSYFPGGMEFEKLVKSGQAAAIVK